VFFFRQASMCANSKQKKKEKSKADLSMSEREREGEWGTATERAATQVYLCAGADKTAKKKFATKENLQKRRIQCSLCVCVLLATCCGQHFRWAKNSRSLWPSLSYSYCFSLFFSLSFSLLAKL